jgi:hypothetical protein
MSANGKDGVVLLGFACLIGTFILFMDGKEWVSYLSLSAIATMCYAYIEATS